MFRWHTAQAPYHCTEASDSCNAWFMGLFIPLVLLHVDVGAHQPTHDDYNHSKKQVLKHEGQLHEETLHIPSRFFYSPY